MDKDQDQENKYLWDDDEEEDARIAGSKQRELDLRTVCQDFSCCFTSPSGKEVLRHLRAEWGVEFNIEPEILREIPIDPLAIAARRALQGAYWTLINYVRQGLAYDQGVNDGRADEFGSDDISGVAPGGPEG